MHSSEKNVDRWSQRENSFTHLLKFFLCIPHLLWEDGRLGAHQTVNHVSWLTSVIADRTKSILSSLSRG